MMNVDKIVNAKGKACIFIGDTHLPYEHRDYLKFCKAVALKYNVKISIHMGDEVDNHAISFHDSDCELFSAGQELDIAITRLQGWYEAFPNMKLLESNHGSLVLRRMKSGGIPIRVLKPLNKLYGTPKWRWYHDILINTKMGPIYLCHGKKSGYLALCRAMGMSTAQGHFHGKHEIAWHKTSTMNIFNAFTACGVDWKSLAFAYGKNHIPKPSLGCLVIEESGIPRMEKMILDSKYRWVGKL